MLPPTEEEKNAADAAKFRRQVRWIIAIGLIMFFAYQLSHVH